MKAHLFAAAAILALSGGSAWAQSSDRTAQDLTRDLNSLPSGAAIAPVSPTPAPTTAPAPAPATTAPAPAAPHQARPAATTPAAAPVPAPSTGTSTLNTTTYGPPAATVAPPASTPRPAATAPTPAPTPTPAPRPATTTPAPTVRPAPTTPAPGIPAPNATRPSTTPPPTTRPAPPPAPSAAVATPAAADPAPAPAPAPAVVAMDAAAISALPFSLTLPPGFVMVEGRAGPNAHIYSVKRGDETFAMIYTGASSQFPIYDGQMVQVGGRTSIVITEDGRRTAAEHLFQRPTSPAEVHVWISSLDGADRTLAEAIAQSLDVR